jgi:hypothetical protein
LSQETANSAANQSTAGLQAQITAANNTSNTALTTANAANATANGIAGTANTALTNANAAVVTANAANATAIAADATANGIAATANAALVLATAAARLVRETAQSTTSGTSIDFFGIPSWAKRVTVVFDNMSTTGGDYPLFQIGDSGGFETTGYASFGSIMAIQVNVSPNVNSVQSNFSTNGFLLYWGDAASARYGTITLTNITGNTWTSSLVAGATIPGSYAGTATGGGTKTLSGTLDRIRLTTTNGVDSFDGGLVNIIYEG